MEKHIKVIGILWIVSGALGLIIAMLIFGVLIGVSFFPDIGEEAIIVLRAVGIGVSFFLAILSIPDIIGGLWLMKRKEWARILVLILAFLNLICIPFGTALGIYSIVILLKQDIARLFK